MGFEPRVSQLLRNNFSESELLTQSADGNITAEDLAAVMEMPVDDDFISVSELNDLIDSVTKATESIIIDSIAGMEGATGDYSNALLEAQLADLYRVISSNEDTLDRLESALQNEIHQGFGSLDDVINTYQSGIIDEISLGLGSLDDVISEVERSIFAQIGGVVSDIVDVVIEETSDIIGTFGPAFDVIQETTDTLVDKTTNVASALATAIPEIGSVVASAVEGVGTAVTAGFGAAFDSVISSLGLDQLINFMQLLGGGMNQASEALDGFSDLDVREGSWDVPASSADVSNMWLMSAPFLGSRLALQYPNEIERLKQIAFEHGRPQLLDAASVLEFIKRNPDAQDVVVHNLELAGYDSMKINQLISMIHQPLGLMENTVALRRGFITPEVFADKLRILGLAPDDVELAEKLSMQLPPIGDLIRMVVRDTFEPDVVEAGKLSEGFEQFPLEFAEQQGINNYWSEKYWQAHWELPSLNQGFEMLHRGKIDQAQLLALFKAADLAPGYWEPMQEIAFRPFSRVDVRRMHLFGVLDESQVLTSYLDLGYDQEKAQALTDFTIAYNESSKKVEKVKERDLTKSDIIGMYNDGVLERDQAFNYLVELGYSEAEATVLIEREDIQADIKERKADIQNIVDQAKIKTLTYEEAQDRLAALDLTRTETNKALSQLARASQTRTRSPSKADLDNWLALTLITSGDYAEELRSLGYADKYVDLYVEETTAEAETDILSEESKQADRKESRTVSKGNLDSLYQAMIINSDDYVLGLTKLGYADNDITNLLLQQTLKLEEKTSEEEARLARGDEAAIKERLPSRSLLGKLFLKGLIDIDSYANGLTLLGFSPGNIELLSKLITAKAEENADKQARADQEAGQVNSG